MSINLNTKPQFLYSNKPQRHSSFKGNVKLTPIDKGFQKLQTNYIVSAVLIDLVAMCIPRGLMDYMTRNPQIGIETEAREVGGTFIHCLLPGLLATGIGFALAKAILGKKAKGILADDNTIKLLHTSWDKANPKGEFYDKNISAEQKEKIASKYVSIALKDVEGIEGDSRKYFKGLAPEVKQKISEDLAKQIMNNDKNNQKIKKTKLESISKQLIEHLKSSESLIIPKTKTTEQVSTSARDLIRDLHDLGNKVFIKASKEKELTETIKKLDKINSKTAVLAVLATITTSGLYHWFNLQQTKKRTGSSGFAGNPDFMKNAKCNISKAEQKKKKKNLIIKKIAAATGIMGIGLATLAKFHPKTMWQLVTSKKAFAKAIEFNGKWPKVPQLAIIYSSAIALRELLARDDNEVNEGVVRDYTGFLNWLVLGGFVSKMSGHLFDKFGSHSSKGKLMNDPDPKSYANSNFFSKAKHVIMDKSLKSHEEINALNISTQEKRKLMTRLNVSLGAGLAYSTLALGVVMPYLCKVMTEHRCKKEKAKAAKEQTIQFSKSKRKPNNKENQIIQK